LNGSQATLVWSSISGAGAYSVGLRDQTTGILASIPLVTGTSTTQPTIPGHSYKWDVASCISAGGGDNTTNCPNRSGDWFFSMQASAPPAPDLISPSNGAVLTGSQATLVWNSVGGAGAYSVGLRDQTTGILADIPLVTGTSTSQPIVAGHSYKWDVASCISVGGGDNTTNCPNRSGDWFFSAQGAAAPSISGVVPNPVPGSSGPQTVTVNGANFVNKPTLTLTWTGQPNYVVPSNQVTFVSSTQVQMSITVGTDTDSWTVKATNPDGQQSNVFSFQVSGATLSDLIPQSINVPSSVTGGTNFTPNWSLANIGSAAANSKSKTVVRINQSTTSASGGNLAFIDTPALSGNSSVPQSATITAPATPGTYYVWIIADDYGSVTNQSDKTNDLQHSSPIAVQVTGQSDLIPQSINVPSSVSPGANFTATWSLANIGSAAANSKSKTAVRINQSTTSAKGSNLAFIDTAALGGNTSAPQNATIAAPTTPGTYYVWILADNYDSVTNQSDTTNDLQHSSPIAVQVSGQSDLIPQSVTVPSSVAPGANFTPTWLLANIGNAAANSKSKTVVRINQSTTSASGKNLAIIDTAALAGNSSVPQNATIAAPTVPGTYYVWVLADNYDSVTNQSNITNDLQHSTQIVVSGCSPRGHQKGMKPQGQCKLVVAYYQPTPYPSQVHEGLHLLDGWVANVNDQNFKILDSLTAGGAGNDYNTYMQFDLLGLPKNVLNVTLGLYATDNGNGSSQTPLTISTPDAPWVQPSTVRDLSTLMTWDNQPTATPQASAPIQGYNSWWSVDITSIYRMWWAGANNGLVLTPTLASNNFDTWFSSRHFPDNVRPVLQLTFSPPGDIPNFKMPLPGGKSWLVTTEAGGYDCMGQFGYGYDVAHDGPNYFSIDYAPTTKEDGDISGDVVVLAAADGKVEQIGLDGVGRVGFYDGNYVVVSHSPDYMFQTRYLHLKSFLVEAGDPVFQGTPIGIMGNTGHDPNGNPLKRHLHFGMRFNDNGRYNTDVQYATVDGWLMKSFQTECTLNADGTPHTWNRFYLSTNQQK